MPQYKQGTSIYFDRKVPRSMETSRIGADERTRTQLTCSSSCDTDDAAAASSCISLASDQSARPYRPNPGCFEMHLCVAMMGLFYHQSIHLVRSWDHSIDYWGLGAAAAFLAGAVERVRERGEATAVTTTDDPAVDRNRGTLRGGALWLRRRRALSAPR